MLRGGIPSILGAAQSGRLFFFSFFLLGAAKMVEPALLSVLGKVILHVSEKLTVAELSVSHVQVGKVFRQGICRGVNQNVLELLHAFLFKGQMIWMESIQCMMYLCSPKLRSLEELEEQKMHISDIAQHDTTRDLILLNQQRLAEIELSNQLERKKEELRILSKNLEAEKKKTETLLYAMLPKHVANLLKEGKKVEAGEFNSCTILFSDIVTFTNICSACEPIQIVNMLNSMYSKFDRLTSVHNVYKVETIGDAYMVVGGVPVPIASHAKRVANFALGMRTAAREVMNPITGEPIQIRVGIHTGPVLAGVVGEKMPRYCLFGDTVNTASRMESHGLPNKIHLSPTTFRYLSTPQAADPVQGLEVLGLQRCSLGLGKGSRSKPPLPVMNSLQTAVCPSERGAR
uniref:guanylate cyclase n=1 Tax=Terrapene triunguis TaxID=2587831 RepID=A0A674K7G5_9SAUR